MAILAVLALSPSVAFAHSPMSSPALKLSVAKRASAAVGGSSGVSRVMTRTPALRAFFDRRHDRRRVARDQQDALGAGRHQLLDRGDLAVIVAIEFAGVGLRRQAELLGLGLEALLHLDEERIGVGLGDEADDRPVSVGRRAGERERDRGGRHSCKNSGDLGHFNSSQRVQAALFPGVVVRRLCVSSAPNAPPGANWAEFRAKVKDNSIRYNNS